MLEQLKDSRISAAQRPPAHPGTSSPSGQLDGRLMPPYPFASQRVGLGHLLNVQRGVVGDVPLSREPPKKAMERRDRLVNAGWREADLACLSELAFEMCLVIANIHIVDVAPVLKLAPTLENVVADGGKPFGYWV